MPLRPAETEAHFAQELDYLTKLSTAIGANHGVRGLKPPPSLPGHPEGGGAQSPFHPGHPGPGKAMSPRNPMEVAPRSRWDVSISHTTHNPNTKFKSFFFLDRLSKEFRGTARAASGSSFPGGRGRGRTRFSKRRHTKKR